MKLTINFLYILFCFYSSIAQNDSSLQIEMKKSIQKEKVFVELNSEVLLAGEALYYKLFCLLQESNNLSDISKIAYVELIGKDTNILFKHKLKLKKGLGYSDFFIPPNINTGHYKIIGYTQWMNNNKENRFFEKDIYIINPYLSYNKEKDSLPENRELPIVNIKYLNNINSVNNEPQNDILKTDSKTYKTRSRVLLNLNNLNNVSVYGNYALSVKKINSIGIDVNLGKENIISDKNFVSNRDFYLPELRGEIISGIVSSKANNTLAANKVIALSIPNKNNYIYKNVLIDASGKFMFNLQENYSNTKCFLQVIDSKPEDFKIELDNKSFKYIDKLKFNRIQLNSNIKEWLVNESISNQMENAYSALKLDKATNRESHNLFYVSPSITYKLDDYKRFSTLRETFVEVIEGTGIRKRKDKYFFRVYNPYKTPTNNYSTPSELAPLILLDGVMIQDNQYLIDYNPYKIEQVNLLRENYFYGPKIFNGIVDIRTKKAGNLESDFQRLKGVHHVNLDFIESEKVYYSPTYNFNQEKLKRIPDYRRQLFWQPEITLNNDKKQLGFYTSDIEGIYEVTLKGYTVSGDYLVMSSSFEVKNE